jgi:short subunit dehydrogenase-like uncharacterized protein
MQFLLYGANGYTAQLMLPLAHRYGLTPVLAGRSADKIQPLAQQFGLEFRVFDLDDPRSVDEGLRDVKAVLNCAGPFAYTARPMLEACLRTGVHYLDITGEISVFELAYSLDAVARQREITLLPGSGFDVVPTDCLARALYEELPDATHLTLAFASNGGGLSQGTALTMADTAGEGGRVRRNGEIVRVPLGQRAETIDFGAIKRFCASIPWGDVATAWHTTGIPNIEVLTATHPKAHQKLRWQWAFNWLLRTNWMRQRLKNKITTRPPGPSEEQRLKTRTYLWGQVRNARGEQREQRRDVPEGYTLTAHSALLLTRKILLGEGQPGFHTPAGLFGKGLIDEVVAGMK